MKRAIPILSCLLILVLVIAFGKGLNEPDPAIITIERPPKALFILKDRGSIARPLNYEVKKNGDTYIITYRGFRPKVLYLNERPLYITPGDKVYIDYRYTANGMDTLIAAGDNAHNYTFSSLLLTYRSGEKEKKVSPFYPTLSDSKYADGTRSYYDDLALYRKVAGKYVDSVLAAESYNMDVRRQAELDNFVMNMFENSVTEDRMLRTGSLQLKDFSNKVELFFESRNISPRDTLLSPNIEGAISLYFDHLKNIKFEPAQTEQRFQDLFNYIRNYPNHFVREYLLYFLMRSEALPLKEKSLVEIEQELAKIENPFIATALSHKAGNEEKSIFLSDWEKQTN
jgi:hypothetical protein